MPYKIYKKNGYKVCKPGGKKCFSDKGLSKEKAEAQQKAIYASTNESLDLSRVGLNLQFKGVYPTADKDEASVYYKIKSEKSSDLIIVYSLGQTPEKTDYKYFAIHDHNDPKGHPQVVEDPSSEQAIKLLAIYDLTPDDVEMAGQDGYDKIVDHMTPEALDEPYEESLQFEKLFDKIIKD